MYRTILKREHHSHITEVDKETHKGYVTQALHLKFEWLPRFSYSLNTVLPFSQTEGSGDRFKSIGRVPEK